MPVYYTHLCLRLCMIEHGLLRLLVSIVWNKQPQTSLCHQVGWDRRTSLDFQMFRTFSAQSPLPLLLLAYSNTSLPPRIESVQNVKHNLNLPLRRFPNLLFHRRRQPNGHRSSL